MQRYKGGMAGLSLAQDMEQEYLPQIEDNLNKEMPDLGVLPIQYAGTSRKVVAPMPFEMDGGIVKVWISWEKESQQFG